MRSDRHLNGILNWIDTVGNEPATTLARFAIELDDLPIWPVWGDDSTDLEVFVDDLLAYLSDTWDELLLQQVYPNGLSPTRPSLLRALAEREAARGPRGMSGTDPMAAVMRFAGAHDLARCFGGIYDLPSFWMLRQGREMLIETSDRVEFVSVDAWLRFASALGDSIAERLITSDSERWHKLVSAWHARDSGDPVRIAALSTGQSEQVASQLVEEQLVPMTASISDAANDNDSLRIAARMIGAIPYYAIRAVLTAAKSIPHRPSAELDRVRERLAAAMADLPESAYPYEQGVFAAKWMRAECDLDPFSRADPVATLDHYGVAQSDENIGPTALDALAIWGDAHGPAVVFNLASRKLQGASGRITWRARKICAAHELCHLVLDFRRTLAAVDILDSRMPLAAEQRANAFAAEFVLPAETAVTLWRRSDLPETYQGVSNILDRLSDRFQVSRTVAGWQLDHGLAGSNQEIIFLLDELLDRR